MMRRTVGIALATLLLAGAAAPAYSLTVERLRPKYDVIRTRNSLKADVMFYAPTVEAVDGPAVVYFSGNWGWRPIMQDTASLLAANGRYVLGVDSMKYFGRIMEPREWEKDLTTFRTYINGKAGRPADAPVILIGFTYGAEMIPYMLNRGGVEGIAGALLIGPGDTGSLLCRLHLQLDLEIPEEERFDVGRELSDLPSMPLVLIEGTADEESKVREMLPLVKTPRRYAPILGGNRQFRETRDVYFEYTAQAIEWIDSTSRSPQAIDPTEPHADDPADAGEAGSEAPVDVDEAGSEDSSGE